MEEKQRQENIFIQSEHLQGDPYLASEDGTEKYL